MIDFMDECVNSWNFSNSNFGIRVDKNYHNKFKVRTFQNKTTHLIIHMLKKGKTFKTRKVRSN